jgi:hypothetical protein
MMFGVPDVDLDDCVAALAARGDNMDAAAGLLFDPDAMAQLRTERVGHASCPLSRSASPVCLTPLDVPPRSIGGLRDLAAPAMPHVMVFFSEPPAASLSSL